MLRNCEYYSEPEKFNPERFLRDGQLNPSVRDPTTLIFGFGRRYGMDLPFSGISDRSNSSCTFTRICPGRHLAMDMGLLNIASVLYAFNINRGIDEQGNQHDGTLNMTTGLVS